MAKAKKADGGGAKPSPQKKTFEERLERLEELGDEIRKNDIPLDEAIKAFEEGIKLARALEKDLEKVESRVEILMNGADSDEDEETDEEAELGLFDNEK
jgi:exodeoxyribonuclease VII small subunit